MKIKTNELTERALDWAVAMTLGNAPDWDMESHGITWHGAWITGDGEYYRLPAYSSCWAQGGPIIEREGINIQVDITKTGQWHAKLARPTSIDPRRYCGHFGPTPLIAAMRCFVASSIGDEVEIPDDLVPPSHNK